MFITNLLKSRPHILALAAATTLAPCKSSLATTPLNTQPTATAPGAVSLNGKLTTPTPVDVITTASGRWHIDYLTRILKVSAYRWQHEGVPATRVMLCRDPATTENHDSAGLSLQKVDVQIGPILIPSAVAQGSCRIVEDAPLAQPNADWIVQAIRDGRLPVLRALAHGSPRARRRSRPCWPITLRSWGTRTARPCRPRRATTSLA